MGNRLKTKVAFILVTLLAAALLPLFGVAKVSAAGETYSWDDSTSISLRGGHLANDSAQHLIRSNSGPTKIFSYPLLLKLPSNDGTSTCVLLPVLTVSADNKTGTVSVPPSDGDDGDSSCRPDSISKFIGSGTVSIANVENSGNASGSGESNLERQIWVWAKLRVDATADQIRAGEVDTSLIPATDTLTLSQNGKVVEEKKNVAFTELKNGQSEVEYFAMFTDRDAGSYRICSERVENCVNFVKIRGQRASIEIPGKNEIIKIATDSAGDNINCESEGGDLSWIMCGILRQLDKAIAELDESIINVLTVPNSYFINDPSISDQPADKLEATWSRLRNISYIILVPIMLVMVISTALGFEIISAYTVKKALPRLIAAILFIALSWQIAKFLVILTNDVGGGIMGLISTSFGSDANIGLADILAPDGRNLLGGAGFTALVIGGFVAVGSIGIIISYALVAVVGLLIGFTLLSLRQMLVVALMLLAPLAILAWIFPGNDKLWKLWWGSFTKLLLLFPLIMVLIASGKSFASIISETDGSLVSTFIKVVAYVGPYFFIPAVFKFAGGVFGNLAGMANDRGKGFFDRNKKYRAEKASQNFAKAKAGTKYNRGWLNAATSRATTRGFGFTGRGQQAYQQKMALAAAEHAKSPQGQAVQHNDGALRALTYESAAEARRNMARDWGMSEEDINSSINAAKASGGFGRARQDYAARQLSLTGTGYDNLEQLGATMARVSHGNVGQMSSLAGDINASTKQANRPDLAPGYANLRALALGQAGLEGGSTDFHGARVLASRGMDPVQILRGKPQNVRNLTESLQQHLTTQTARMQDTSLSREQRAHAMMEVKQTIGQITQLDANRSYASHDNQMAVNELTVGTRDTGDIAMAYLESLPAQPDIDHMEDIRRFSEPRTDADDPNLQNDQNQQLQQDNDA